MLNVGEIVLFGHSNGALVNFRPTTYRQVSFNLKIKCLSYCAPVCQSSQHVCTCMSRGVVKVSGGGGYLCESVRHFFYILCGTIFISCIFVDGYSGVCACMPCTPSCTKAIVQSPTGWLGFQGAHVESHTCCDSHFHTWVNILPWPVT